MFFGNFFLFFRNIFLTAGILFSIIAMRDSFGYRQHRL